MGVAELEVPAAGSGRRDGLRTLDAHPEAPARRRGADRGRGVEGGRPHGGRSPVRGGGDRGQRSPQGPGRPSASRRRRPRRRSCRPTQASQPPFGRRRTGARTATTTTNRGRAGSTGREGRERRALQAAPPAPAADEHAGRSRRPGCRSGWEPERGPVTPRARSGAGIGSAWRGAQPRHQATPPDLTPLPSQAGGSRASMYSMTRRVSCDGVEAPLVTPTFLAPFSQPMSRSSSRSTR